MNVDENDLSKPGSDAAVFPEIQIMFSSGSTPLSIRELSVCFFNYFVSSLSTNNDTYSLFIYPK